MVRQRARLLEWAAISAALLPKSRITPSKLGEVKSSYPATIQGKEGETDGLTSRRKGAHFSRFYGR